MSGQSLREELDGVGEQEEGVWGKSSPSMFSASGSGFGLGGDGRIRGGRDWGTPLGYDYTASLPPVTPEEGVEVSPEVADALRVQQAKKVRFQKLRTQWENSDQELERLSLRVDEEKAELVQLQSQLEEEEVLSPRSPSGIPEAMQAPRVPAHVPPHLSVSSGETKDSEMVRELRMLRMANARLAEQLAMAGSGAVQGAMRNSKYGRSDPPPLVPFERSLSR